MKKDRKIAIIMCVYINDRLSDLQESLKSLYDQTFKEFDIFIQCDGPVSSDMKIFLDVEKRSGKIALLRERDENYGFPVSLNELLKIGLSMQYDYFVRMDADDICCKSRIETQFLFMEKNANIDVLGSDIIEFYNDSTEKLVRYPTEHEGIKANFCKKTALPHVTAFFRRSFFIKSGVYNERSNRNEDQWLWLDGFLNNCNFASISSPLVKVRLTSDLLSRRGEFRHNLDTFLLRNRIVFKLKCNFLFYLYNFSIFLIKCLPVPLLKVIYKLR